MDHEWIQHSRIPMHAHRSATQRRNRRSTRFGSGSPSPRFVVEDFAPFRQFIFLTQEFSAEVVQEALSLGARCYVVKVKAASELLTAVESVLLGKTFVTSIIGSG